MAFMRRQIHFLCSQKKASRLEVVKRSAKEAVSADVVIHVKAKSDDGSSYMEDIISAVQTLSKSNGDRQPVVGNIARENPEGKLLVKWSEKLKNANFQQTYLLSRMLANSCVSKRLPI
ncbi:hypothetical protein MLD38_020705 [Melastoma candidum]|nr:hypothetical protein MLD38_020705 [Melastoma candidum]